MNRVAAQWSMVATLCVFSLAAMAQDPVPTTSPPPRWSAEKALQWQAEMGWLVGCNYLPSTAINQLEMWQADTFDPATIDRELGWAAGIGMNTVRVFLHDIPWRQDPEGFLGRIDQFLKISARHGIRPLIVLFDGCWDPEPKPGQQPAPTPGVHNSGWVQAPGKVLLADASRHDELRPYVQGVVRHFAEDKRVLMWDLFNEPDNSNANSYGENGRRTELDPKTKADRATELLEKVFLWVRDVRPSQPLTAGVWAGDYLGHPSPMARLMLDNSDILSFHSYDQAERARELAAGLKLLGRPVVCTEYMSRGSGSTFETVLPVFKELNVGAYNWGLVAGKMQTNYPWDSWQHPYAEEPEPWFHDVFRQDGTPYREEETRLLRALTSADGQE